VPEEGVAPATMRAQVERALLQVPAGRVTTYGDIARALGDIRAARAVGEVLSTNAMPDTVPCHRVVMADGSLGGYAFGGPGAKAKRLRREGVEVRAGAVVGLGTVAVREFDLKPIFREYAERQRALARRVRTARTGAPLEIAIGVDASYTVDDREAFAAAVAVEAASGKIVDRAVAKFRPPVPYVPGYLAFRELPGIVAAVGRLSGKARKRAAILVDGQGILHPRRCGIASMAGLELGMPAVGVAKRRLLGEAVGSPRPIGPFEARTIEVDGEGRGLELRQRGRSHALFVSPGTGLTVLEAGRLAAVLTRPGDKSPRPIALADELSRRARSAAAAAA